MVRLPERLREQPRQLARLPIALPDAEEGEPGYIPLGEVADIRESTGPNQVNRENGKRNVVVSANVRDRDLGSFIAEVQQRLEQELVLPSGYWLGYGGSFEQLQSASQRLMVVIPVALLSISACW